jgi:predicted DsbA family dithiol-disulfide isomerase
MDPAEPAAAEIEIDVVSDVVCPWCALGWAQLARAIERTGVRARVRWHPFELNPDMDDEGRNLHEHLGAKYGTDARANDEVRARLSELGAEVGVSFDWFPEMRIVNTFRAHRLLHWAGPQGRTHALMMTLFGAYFGRRRDVNDVPTLLDCAWEAGLDRAGAEAALADPKLGEEVRRLQRFWIEAGVDGVPAVAFQRRVIVGGAQGVDAYADLLRRMAGAAPAA